MSTNYEFKKISDVDVIETVNDSAHVIIEDAGILKKMAAKNIGAVKTVNGTEPDESGNVVVEVSSGGGVTNWNDLTHKPFAKFENKTIEWDGNTDGRDYAENGGTKCYRVSDYIPVHGIGLDTVPISISVNGYDYSGNAKTASTTEWSAVYISEYSRNIPNFGYFALKDEVEEEGYSGNLITFPKKGLYVYENITGVLPPFTIEFSEAIRTIDESYIPDIIARVEDIPEHTWQSLPDKPFGEKDSYTTVFERTEPLSITKSMNKRDWATNRGDRIICVCDGIEYTFDRVSEGFYFHYGKDAYNSGESPIYFQSNATMDSGGIYVKDDGEAHEVTYTVYQKVSEVITLDEKYIPKAAAVSDVTAAPTAEEFNALLAALRNAGLMAT